MQSLGPNAAKTKNGKSLVKEDAIAQLLIRKVSAQAAFLRTPRCESNKAVWKMHLQIQMFERGQPSAASRVEDCGFLSRRGCTS